MVFWVSFFFSQLAAIFCSYPTALSYPASRFLLGFNVACELSAFLEFKMVQKNEKVLCNNNTEVRMAILTGRTATLNSRVLPTEVSQDSFLHILSIFIFYL